MSPQQPHEFFLLGRLQANDGLLPHITVKPRTDSAFLGIPQELRDMIYAEALNSTAIILKHGHVKIFVTHILNPQDPWTTYTRALKGLPAWFPTSK